MIGIVAKIRIKEGANADFEAVAKQLVAAVNEKEPGCTLYALHKSDDPLVYVFMERYVDDDAVAAHRGTDHFKSLGREMGAFMDGRPEVEILREV